MARARHSQQDGRWDERLGCWLQRLVYDARTRTGRLDFPPANCCDMTGAINLFTAIDPDVRVIETFAGGVPDKVYRREDGEWAALTR